MLRIRNASTLLSDAADRVACYSAFFFLMIRRPPRSTLFPTRRSSDLRHHEGDPNHGPVAAQPPRADRADQDRKSTRLNSSHTVISYAVFCLKKKKNRFLPWSTRSETDMACTHYPHIRSPTTPA